MTQVTRVILGVDPGLTHTGWGVIRYDGSRLSFVACGTISPPKDGSLAERLARLQNEMKLVIEQYGAKEAALEETFLNKNPKSSLILSHARGVVMAAMGSAGLKVCEYAPNTVKKTVVGAGHAQKEQVSHMIGILLPAAKGSKADAADALAVAICHAHQYNFAAMLA